MPGPPKRCIENDMLAPNCILTFHALGEAAVPLEPDAEPYRVSEDAFSQTLGMLSGLEAAHGVKFQITFDDGYLSDYAIGFPGLAEAGRGGTFFVLAGRLDQPGSLTREQIREMHDHGMEIGTHGWDHVDWRTLDDAGRQREFADARKVLEDVTGAPVTKAAIPFGRFDAAVLKALKRHAYAQVFTSTAGLSLPHAWFQPRWSPKKGFDPGRDLPQTLGFPQKIKGAVFAGLRPIRYRYAF